MDLSLLLFGLFVIIVLGLMKFNGLRNTREEKKELEDIKNDPQR